MIAQRERGLYRELNRPLYGFADVDHLAGVSRGTAQRWLAGYAYRGAHGHRIVRPPVTPGAPGAPGVDAVGAVSFLDLVEIVAIGRLKERGFSLKDIRLIVANCQEILGLPRPLSTLRFKVGGREAFVKQGDVLVEVGRRRRMQAWDDVLHPFLEELDYAEDFARRWWPLGRQHQVMIDPEYGFGLPVVAGSGVRTEIILERFRVGDLEHQIADNFNITSIEVQRALQFEIQRAA